MGAQSGSVWPELQAAAAILPGGIVILPLVIIGLAYGATRLLDRTIDALDPA